MDSDERWLKTVLMVERGELKSRMQMTVARMPSTPIVFRKGARLSTWQAQGRGRGRWLRQLYLDARAGMPSTPMCGVEMAVGQGAAQSRGRGGRTP